MTVIVTLDDGGGMMFNRRRQSQDRIVRDKILELASGSRLLMNAYTYKQFQDAQASGTVGEMSKPVDGTPETSETVGGTPESIGVRIASDENFLENASADDFCFVEGADVSPYLDRIGRVIVFRWNRAYPSDVRFPVDLTAPPWKLVRTDEFPGFSHEKITEEIYVCE